MATLSRATLLKEEKNGGQEVPDVTIIMMQDLTALVQNTGRGKAAGTFVRYYAAPFLRQTLAYGLARSHS
ncbi:hypothetical protein GJAV_G00071660 [Gymnothorax javanicus]|nr:hypothetical protein GJAV_G00071660 [Gymnothorax javanicus]